MSLLETSRTPGRTTSLPVVSLAALLLAAGCPKEEAPAAKPSMPAAAPAPAKPAGASADAPEYAVTLSAPSGAKAGVEAAATFAITAKGTFHVNPDYPLAFTPEGSKNAKFAGDKVKLSFGEKTPCAAKAEDACAVTVPLAVTPEQAGAATIAGTLAFSVCDPERCLIQKVPLEVALNAE
jgi:hypothetical protein